MHRALPSTTLYYKACTRHFPVLLCTAKLAQTTSQYYFVLQSVHKACTKHFSDLPSTTSHKNFAASPTDTTTWAEQNERSFAASRIDTTTPEDKQRLRFCSFPHRHGDVRAAKRTRFCSFPHRHGDARGQAEADALQLPP